MSCLSEFHPDQTTTRRGVPPQVLLPSSSLREIWRGPAPRIGREEATTWIGFWSEDIILRYYGFFPPAIGGLLTEGDRKLLLHEIGWIWYGYSLLIDRVEDRREEATIWIGFWTEDIILRYYDFFPLVIGGLPTEGDGKLILHEIGWIWYGHSLHRQSRG